MFQEQELLLKKPCSDLPLFPILICFQIQTVVSWVQPMSLQWVFCCTVKLWTWRAVSPIQMSLQVFKPKKNKQNETLSLSKSSESNYTFKAICQTAGFRRKINQARVWKNSGWLVLVWWLVVGLFFFSLPFIWLGLSILFSLLHASTCHHGPVLLHMQMNKNKKKELPVEP